MLPDPDIQVYQCLEVLGDAVLISMFWSTGCVLMLLQRPQVANTHVALCKVLYMMVDSCADGVACPYLFKL